MKITFGTLKSSSKTTLRRIASSQLPPFDLARLSHHKNERRPKNRLRQIIGVAAPEPDSTGGGATSGEQLPGQPESLAIPPEIPVPPFPEEPGPSPTEPSPAPPRPPDPLPPNAPEPIRPPDSKGECAYACSTRDPAGGTQVALLVGVGFAMFGAAPSMLRLSPTGPRGAEIVRVPEGQRGLGE